jgi:NifU-like protein involved in Fe-S cluster formation
MSKYSIEDIIELANDRTYRKELDNFDVVVEGRNPGCGDYRFYKTRIRGRILFIKN